MERNTGIYTDQEDQEETQSAYSGTATTTTSNNGLNPVPEEDTNTGGHFERDIEKPQAIKKSDSFSGARPVSTASIDSNRRGSGISMRPITRGDSIAEEAEPTEQIAEDTSSSHAQPLHGRRNRRRPLSATSGSKTDSSPENSLSSYSAEHEFFTPAAPVMISVETFTMMQREISTLKETDTMTRKEISMLKESDTVRQKEVSTLKETVTMMQNEISTLKERVTMVENEFLPALDRRIGHLELRNTQKDTNEPTTATGQLIAIPEHSESLDNQSKAHQISTMASGANTDASAREVTISDESGATTVDIPCEAHTSSKSTNSAPFFSDAGDCGYQMCINLSRSEDFNPELTFALVLMRGKLDKNLHWPFNRKIVLTVISNDASKHLVITIQPKSEKSFQRPKYDLNEPFAFLKKHYTVLFDGGFINDDKVAIQVTVT